MVSKLEIPVSLNQPLNNDAPYLQLLDRMPGAIYACDQDGRITFYNEASARLWGRKPKLRKDFWCGSWKIYENDGVTPLPLEKCPMARKLSGRRVRSGTEIVVERPDGVKRNVAVYPELIYDTSGNVVGAVSMLIDITGQKHAEKVLREGRENYRKMAEDLELRVQKRTKALREANEYLERSNQELEQFAFVTSHDLQEPLRKIQTFGELLSERHAGNLDEKGKAYLNKIISSSKRLSLLINGLLTFSLLNQPGGTMKKVDLNQVLQNVLDDYELLIRQKNATIKADNLPKMKADSLQINQLFSNLIGNALKFSREDVPPVVDITTRKLPAKEVATHAALDKKQSYFEIVVSDNGIGFAQKYAEQIFDVFQRLHDRTIYEGTGIGLTICAKAVANHKGLIYARSEESHGASFLVVLPVDC